jgi:hypothetical protein
LNQLPDTANPTPSEGRRDDIAASRALETRSPAHDSGSVRTAVDATGIASTEQDKMNTINIARGARLTGRLSSDAGQEVQEPQRHLPPEIDLERQAEAALIDDEFGFFDVYTPIGVVDSGARASGEVHSRGNQDSKPIRKVSPDVDLSAEGSVGKDDLIRGQELGTGRASTEIQDLPAKGPPASQRDTLLDIVAMNASVLEESGALSELLPRDRGSSPSRTNAFERSQHLDPETTSGDVAARPGGQRVMPSSADGIGKLATGARSYLRQPSSDNKLEPQAIDIDDEGVAPPPTTFRSASPVETVHYVPVHVVYDLADDAQDINELGRGMRQASGAFNSTVAKSVPDDDDEIEVVGFRGPKFVNS